MFITYWGENSFLIQEKLAAVKKAYEAKFSSGLNFFKFDAEENLDDLKSSLDSQSMFAEKKLVFLRSILNCPEPKWLELKEFLSRDSVWQKSDDVVLIGYDFVLEKVKEAGKKRLEFFKTLGQVKEFKNLEKPKLIDWLLKKTEESVIKVSRSDLAYLIGGIGSDAGRIWNEVLKLASYGQGIIKRKDIDSLVAFDVVSNNFKVVDALLNKNPAWALKSLADQWRNNVDPVLVLGALVWQFRILIRMSLGKISSPGEAVQKIKISPWVAQKSWVAARRFSSAELKSIYQNLADIDLAIKTGERDGREALSDFIYGFLKA